MYGDLDLTVRLWLEMVEIPVKTLDRRGIGDRSRRASRLLSTIITMIPCMNICINSPHHHRNSTFQH